MTRMKNRGSLVVISGFSGSGKGSVTKELIRKYGYSLSVSMTTRKPREGEVDGREYHFKTEEDFLKLIDYNGFIEYARYVDHYYGTPRQFVEDELAAGHCVLLEIEVQGAVSIKEQYPDAILIFITAPSAESLKKRLCCRGTEDSSVIEKRMHRAAAEAESIDEYQYIVINDDGKMNECVDKIHSIIEGEACRVSVNHDFVELIQRELNEEQPS